MNKKLLCLALALMMVCMASVAFAAGSKSTGNMTTSTTKSTGSGAVAADPVAVSPAAQNAISSAVLAEIQAILAGGSSVVDYFDADAQAAIVSLLPTGADARALVMNELFPLVISNAEGATGSVTVSFQCATAYADGQAVVAMLGVTEGGSTTWTALRASVIGGKVVVTFTQAQLQAIASGNAVLAILS